MSHKIPVGQKIALAIYSGVAGRKIRNLISEWPHYQQINDSGWKQIYRLKSRIILSVISESLRESKQSRLNREKTKFLKNTETGEVLVLGGGPSVANLSIAQIKRFQDFGGKIAVMNGFLFSNLAAEIVPDYYFILDPGYWNTTELSEEFRRRLSDFLDRAPITLKLVHPADQASLLSSNVEVIHVGGRMVSGLKRIASPYSFWGLPASTALMSIATLKFLGYERVFFAGLDSDTYKNYFVNDLNEVLFSKSDNYFYDEPKLGQIESFDIKNNVLSMHGLPIRHMADVLYSCSVFMRDMAWLTQSGCINVGNDLTNDSSPRACLLT